MGSNQSNRTQEVPSEKVKTPPPKIPRLYMSMVRKRTLTVSVYDYPEHLNPFREEEEIERRAAQAALEGRTSRCHLLPMSPYATLGRSPKSKIIDLSPTSSGASTPVNGTLRRRMKRRAPLPPVANMTAVSLVTSPTTSSSEAASPPTERSRPTTPPLASPPLPASASTTPPICASPSIESTSPSPDKQTLSEDTIKTSSDFQEPIALNCNESEDKDQTEANLADCNELPIQTKFVCDADTAATLPQEHDPPATMEIPPEPESVTVAQDEKEEEIERLNTERPEELVTETLISETNNLDVENNNNSNILLENKSDEIIEIKSKSEPENQESDNNSNNEDDDNDEIIDEPINLEEISEDIKTNKENKTDEAFQDKNIILHENNIEESADIEERMDNNLITTNDNSELPYIDQDTTSNIEVTDENKTISNGHISCNDKTVHNGLKQDPESLAMDSESTLAPSPVPRRSKSPSTSKNEKSPTKPSTPTKPAQDKYATQVSHYEIKITDLTDV